MPPLSREFCAWLVGPQADLEAAARDKAAVEAWRATHTSHCKATAAKPAVNKGLPKALSLQTAMAFLPVLPSGKQPTLHESTFDGRLRAFYPAPSRPSTSASLRKYDGDSAIRWCLKWLWQQHTSFTGEACPWPELVATGPVV